MSSYSDIDRIYSEIDRIENAKDSIKSSIEGKGITVPEGTHLDEMSPLIDIIGGSGGGGGGLETYTEPLDPVAVYHATRPADWLPMPEPQDNEMYLLFHIPDGCRSLLAFTITCTGSYTVALGTVSGGAFVQQSSTSVASKTKYEAELDAADYGDLTSTGMKQVMIKVSGTNILTFEPKAHSKKTLPSNYANWDIVEIACNLSKATKVMCGASSANLALKKLVYFAMYGENAITSHNYMFRYCYSLLAILSLYTGKSKSMTGMCNYCYSLVALPQMDTRYVENMNGMFNYCSALPTFYEMDTSSLKTASEMCSRCYSLVALPHMDTSHVTSFASMCNQCYVLRRAPQLDMSSADSIKSIFSGSGITCVPAMRTPLLTNATDAFLNCYALSSVLLDNTVTGWAGCDLSLANASLMHDAILALIDSLPAITEAHAITLTGNPGAAELTDEEIAIAAGKGWTITI